VEQSGATIGNLSGVLISTFKMSQFHSFPLGLYL